MNTAIYNGPNLDNSLMLAQLLGLSYSEIESLASVLEQSYSIRHIPKKNGGHRTINEPDRTLKQIQRLVLERILRQVAFPNYIYGGVPGKDYISDARQHTGRKKLINADIKDFYPSVLAKHVNSVWIGLCGFPEDVSGILTALTTYKGCLPQGAPTSCDIANLVLWDVEPEFVDDLSERGYLYSRYVDDISISCIRAVEPREINLIVDKLRFVLALKGLKLNLAKLKISDNSGRMVIHNINVNKGRPTKSKEERAKIRAAVRECEIRSQDTGRSSMEYKQLYLRTYGRVNEIYQLHPVEASKLLDRLNAVKPTTDVTSFGHV